MISLGAVDMVKRMRRILGRLLAHRRRVLPPDPFGDPGGPVVSQQTADSVALTQLPISQTRAAL